MPASPAALPAPVGVGIGLGSGGGAAPLCPFAVALEEIESVSTQLADLIQNISNAARKQAVSAGHVSNTMNVIQEITGQTATSTQVTATSIAELSEMANEMRSSVEGFKLPDQASA